jgi:hypothetical protein
MGPRTLGRGALHMSKLRGIYSKSYRDEWGRKRPVDISTYEVSFYQIPMGFDRTETGRGV